MFKKVYAPPDRVHFWLT